MAGLKGGTLQGPPSCSVCFETVSDAAERSIAKLTCGHQFHLDCIGSAFNSKGCMQCPNCRRVEHGRWLYANGGHQREDPFLEDIIEEEYDLFPGVLEFPFPHDYMVGHVQWCPYQGSYAQLSLSLGDADHHVPDHADLVVNVLVGENLGSSESLQPCPIVLTPTIITRVSGAEENVRGQESIAHSHPGARNQRQVSSPRAQWGYQPPPAGAVGGHGLLERSRWPQQENYLVEHAPPQARYHGRRRPFTSAQSMDNYTGSQFASATWDDGGQSVLQNTNREAEPRVNAVSTQRRQEGTSAFRQYSSERGGPSAFRQYPSEREGQRWAPPPLSGLYGAHGILGSELPTQVGYGTMTPSTQIPSLVPGSFHAFQPYAIADDVDSQPTPSILPPR